MFSFVVYETEIRKLLGFDLFAFLKNNTFFSSANKVIGSSKLYNIISTTSIIQCLTVMVPGNFQA